MPSAYKIDKEQRLVTSSAWGVVTREDVFSHQQKINSGPGFCSDIFATAGFYAHHEIGFWRSGRASVRGEKNFCAVGEARDCGAGCGIIRTGADV